MTAKRGPGICYIGFGDRVRPCGGGREMIVVDVLPDEEFRVAYRNNAGMVCELTMHKSWLDLELRSEACFKTAAKLNRLYPGRRHRPAS